MGFVRYCHAIPFILLYGNFVYVASYNLLALQYVDRPVLHAISGLVMIYSVVEISMIMSSAIAHVLSIKWRMINESNGIPAKFILVMYAIIRVSSQHLIDRTWQIFVGNPYFDSIYLYPEARKIVRASVSIQAVMVLCATICTMRYYLVRDMMIEPMKNKMEKEEGIEVDFDGPDVVVFIT